MVFFLEKVGVIGLGEVGRSLYEIVLEAGCYEVYGLDVDPEKTIDRFQDAPKNIDYIHVCYPYSEDFISETLKYIGMYNPKSLIIHSTVPPGTSRTIYERSRVTIGYSPVRGRHPRLKDHLRFWSKWLSVIPSDQQSTMRKHLEKLGFKVRVCDDPETLELAKLFETVYRALMIAFWQEAHRITLKHGGDIGVIADFIGEVHEVLRDRPVYYPGHIGGHCLIPNTKILDSIEPNPLWKFIIESNEKRMLELEEDRVREDVEKVKKIWLKLVPEWYF